MLEYGGRFTSSTNLEAGGHMLTLLHASGVAQTLTQRAVAHSEYQAAHARSYVLR